MLVIVIGMMFVLGVALTVIISVAWPNIRAGAWVLTPEGERLTRGARRRARKAASTARTAATTVAATVRDLRGVEPAEADAADDAGDDGAGRAAGGTASPDGAARPYRPAVPAAGSGAASAPAEPNGARAREETVIADKVAAGIAARTRPEKAPEKTPGAPSSPAVVPPSQHGSPLATPATGVSETIRS
ncbi:MAG: hypothetical protein JNL54_16940 [Kineosporiaceae bacterium]|nr:hypothetical protein [Kineosporiaceae bacterium]